MPRARLPSSPLGVRLDESPSGVAVPSAGARNANAPVPDGNTTAASLTKDVADHGGEASITLTKIGLIGRVGNAAVGGQLCPI
jgi:hypothetical protein